jgi:hypothetical protein
MQAVWLVRMLYSQAHERLSLARPTRIHIGRMKLTRKDAITMQPRLTDSCDARTGP